jgi:hypothetical protein
LPANAIFFDFATARRYFEFDQDIMARGEACLDIKVVVPSTIGGKATCRLTSKLPLRNDLGVGVVVGLIGVSREMTERKRQEELRRGQALLEMIARNEPLEIVLEAPVLLVEAGLAQTMKLAVVAEGVETHAQFDFLRLARCRGSGLSLFETGSCRPHPRAGEAVVQPNARRLSFVRCRLSPRQGRDDQATLPGKLRCVAGASGPCAISRYLPAHET